MRIVAFFLLLTVVCIAGCEGHTTLALVVRTDQMTRRNGSVAPTIPLLRQDGKTTTLAKAAYPFYLVAFVEATGQPDYLSPAVENIAKGLWLDSISVAQITVPTREHPFPDDVLQQCTPRKENLILVLDPKKLAWEMFERPAFGTLVLIDRYGYIHSVGSLSNSRDVLFDTYQLQKKWEQDQFEEHFSLSNYPSD
ncbi:MAG: hypothetical protein JXA11_07090 [Phycisphaerae bacterium]|nr:hypothetical protein [Phycisphaerae bacterium]